MIIKPKYKGFICTTAHPDGCRENIKDQIDYVKSQGKFKGPKKVLVLGSSAGYGLSSRIVSTFCNGASTIGVFFERPYSNNKTASAGWYNTAAFEKFAIEEGYYAKSINGDAFSKETKKQVIDLIKNDLGKIDMLIYSLAAPRRTHPETGEVFNSCLKPIKNKYTGKTIDVHTGIISDVTIDVATEKEISGTVAVMGGEDWKMWIEELVNEGVCEENFITMAYDYIGPSMTHPIYRDGTIGKAKQHLESTSKEINETLKSLKGKAYVSVNKALVTQASSAIPVVPLYISILYKVMKEKGTHEDCTGQIYRLFRELNDDRLNIDEKGRIRIDNFEMEEDVQKEVLNIWEKVSTENVDGITDLLGYRKEFFNLFGFNHDRVDYEKETDIEVNIQNL